MCMVRRRVRYKRRRVGIVLLDVAGDVTKRKTILREERGIDDHLAAGTIGIAPGQE